MSQENYALQLSSYGQADSLTLTTSSMPVAGKKEVLLHHLFSPIHPSDLGTIAGSYGQLDPLPTIPGREGVARIVGVGKGLRSFWINKLVYINHHCWQTYSIADPEKLVFVSPKISAIQAALLQINPTTAFCLLKKFVKLKAGDWIIQNAANSAVGTAVIQLAKHFGYHTINIVRNKDYIEPLLQLGADKVILNTDSEPILERPKLGLNAVGDMSVFTIAKSLAPNAKLITFGGMPSQNIKFPTRQLIFNNISMHGFWLHNYTHSLDRIEYSRLIKKIENFALKGIIRPHIHSTFPVQEYQNALLCAANYNKLGKVLLDFESKLP